ncbi:protein YLS9-like [Pyrus ussuriensis x Pyrus communis]|uniref:Protein YLS9-like n=1 Tax=Pyrus ussuriensis x Pyrus communis TaxID=2448454 RepID=A0A5N5GM47_9ROSA|nr:protein YLS9-like [Pyrus ussuriensis x Pyrus communis]
MPSLHHQRCLTQRNHYTESNCTLSCNLALNITLTNPKKKLFHALIDVKVSAYYLDKRIGQVTFMDDQWMSIPNNIAVFQNVVFQGHDMLFQESVTPRVSYGNRIQLLDPSGVLKSTESSSEEFSRDCALLKANMLEDIDAFTKFVDIVRKDLERVSLELQFSCFAKDKEFVFMHDELKSKKVDLQDALSTSENLKKELDKLQNAHIGVVKDNVQLKNERAMVAKDKLIKALTTESGVAVEGVEVEEPVIDQAADK